MAPETPLDHDQLMTLAHKVRAAAQDQDIERLRRSTLRISEALIEHMAAEAPALHHLPPGEARLLRRGQERVMRDVIDIVLASHLLQDCRCNSAAEELLARLSLQAQDERRHFTATGSAA